MTKLLSVCMIVKDEQDVLARCLNSIHDLADEIIIVDTGSTDSTKEIALKYTEHVYDFKWVNDFSAARNESIRYATSKWILVLDADEYIKTEDIAQIRFFLENESVHAKSLFTISVFSFVGKTIHSSSITESAIPRLLANFQGIQYERPIHEQPVDAQGVRLQPKSAPISVFHTGYTADVIEKKDKLNRNEQIFNSLKQKNGFTPYDLFSIGNEFVAKGDLKKALYNYERAFKKATSKNPWASNCAFEIWNIYLKLDRISDAWKLNETYFKNFESFPEYSCFQGIMFEQLGMFEEAKAAFLKAIALSETLSLRDKNFWLVNPSFGSSVPLERLAHLSSVEQNLKDVVYYQSKLLQANPNNYNALLRIIEVFLQKESHETIKQYIAKLYPLMKQQELHMLVTLFTSLGQSELAAIYYKKLHSSDALQIDIKLKYAILQGDENGFDHHLHNIKNPVNKSSLILISIGSLLWKASDHRLSLMDQADQQLKPNAQLYKQLIIQDFPEEFTEEQTHALFDLLNELFNLQQFDVFERIVQMTEHSELLNLLANFLFSKHEIDKAVTYYQTLLEKDQLSAKSCMNLAYLHYNNKLFEDSVAFFESALEMNPKLKQLYVPLIKSIQDVEKKELYRKKLFFQYPHYIKLPIIQHL